MKGKGILLLTACFLVWIGPVYAQPQPGSPWPMIHHDQYHTGRSPYNGPETSTLKWSFSTGNDIIACPAIAADRTIYIASADDYLYAINPDGTEKWRFPLGSVTESSPAIGADGTIYVGSNTPLLYAVNPDGTEKWTFDMGLASIYPSPTIGQDGTIYVGTLGNGTLYALNPDGTEQWSYSVGIGKYLYDSPSISPDGTVYVQADDGYLYAFSSTGSLLWQYYVKVSGGGYRASTSFSVADSTVYTGGADDTLYALSPDGSLKWTFPAGGRIYAAPSIGTDGTIYFGCEDDTFYALYSSGDLKWSYTTAGGIVSSAAIDSDGTIYFGTVGPDSTKARVYALNPDGTFLWSYGLPARIRSSPAIDADGTLYIGCDDGNLYAFGTPTGVARKDRFQVFRYQLLQNRPNPFIASAKGTAIRYGISNAGQVSLKVYDVTGRLVQTLVKGKKKAGLYSVPWDGKDPGGKKLASGIYFYRVESGSFRATKKLILLR